MILPANYMVLVVEDEKPLAEVLQDEFKAKGFAVHVALDGEAAVEHARKHKPDIILLDLLLPKKNGFEVLEELKSDPDLKHIPVIILSNLGQDEEVRKGLALGAVDYFVKTEHPISEVIEKVQQRLLTPNANS